MPKTISLFGMMDSESINYVLKKDNPGNRPDIKLIKKFWQYLKGLVFKKEWEAKNV